jgi:hypothetical protein
MTVIHCFGLKVTVNVHTFDLTAAAAKAAAAAVAMFSLLIF